MITTATRIALFMATPRNKAVATKIISFDGKGYYLHLTEVSYYICSEGLFTFVASYYICGQYGKTVARAGL